MPTDYNPRTPTQTVWLAAAAALVVVVVVGGGWLAWLGLTRHTAPTPTPTPTPASDPPAAAAPTTVDGPRPEKKSIGGVPWGFPLTADGAAAAAVTAVAVTGQPQAVFDPEGFAQIAEVVFTPEVAEAQAREVEAARVEFDLSGWDDQPPSRRLYHFTPLAVRLTTFDPETLSATVEVWALTVAGVGDAGGAVFTTSTLHLTATDATWQVAGVDTVEGPTPLVAGSPSPPGRTRAQLRDAVPTLPLPVGTWP